MCQIMQILFLCLLPLALRIRRIGSQHLVRLSVHHQPAALHPQGPVAEAHDRGVAVRGEEHDARLPDHGVQPLLRALREFGVAHADDLVEDQDVGVHGRADSEGEPQHHAARIGADRQVQKLAQLAELLDIGDDRLGLLVVAAEHDAAHADVVIARGVGVHAHREVEKRGHAALDRHLASSGWIDAAEHPQERRLAGPVAADEADPVAVARLEAHLVQGLHDLDASVAVVLQPSPHGAAKDLTFQGAPARIVDGKLDTRVLEEDMGHDGYSQ